MSYVTKESHEFEILRINSRGEGISYLEDGRVIFIRGTIPGEKVLATVETLKKKYATGEVKEILKPHPERVNAGCKWYGACGGCQLQHCSYSLQMKLKKQILLDALRRIGHLCVDDKISDCEASPRDWGYRNKASFPVRESKGIIKTGFFRMGSHHLVPVDTCPVLEPELDIFYEILKKELIKTGIQGYCEQAHRGLLRHILLRKTSFGKDIFICIVLKNNPGKKILKKIKDLAKRLALYNENFSGMMININPLRTNTILGNKSLCIYGKDYLTEFLGDKTLEYVGTSFFQINSYQALKVFNYTAAEVKRKKHERVLELYSGAGAITVFIADESKAVVAVEDNKSSILSMKKNIKLNLSSNIKIYEDKVEDILRDIEEDKFDIVVIDPPRSGCKREVLDFIASRNIPRIVYVSCNPSTLARDISILTDKGYELDKARPFDMFPQTCHVETVATLEKR